MEEEGEDGYDDPAGLESFQSYGMDGEDEGLEDDDEQWEEAVAPVGAGGALGDGGPGALPPLVRVESGSVLEFVLPKPGAGGEEPQAGGSGGPKRVVQRLSKEQVCVGQLGWIAPPVVCQCPLAPLPLSTHPQPWLPRCVCISESVYECAPCSLCSYGFAVDCGGASHAPCPPGGPPSPACQRELGLPRWLDAGPGAVHHAFGTAPGARQVRSTRHDVLRSMLKMCMMGHVGVGVKLSLVLGTGEEP